MALFPRKENSLPEHFERAQDEFLNGDLEDAIRLFEALVRDWTLYRGADSEWAQVSRHCLGEALIQAKQWSEAEVVFAVLLVDRVRILGPEDPLSISTRRLYSIAEGHGRPVKFC